MAQANQEESTGDLVTNTVRRKRGRPRKDEILGSEPSKRNRRPRNEGEYNGSEPYIGQVVSGVLDGKFDAGYMLTVQAGGRGSVLRGLVFEPGLSVPISLANDVAPSATMFERNQVPVPSATWQGPGYCNPGRLASKREVGSRSQSRSESKPLLEDLNVSVSQMSPPVDQVKDLPSTSGEGCKIRDGENQVKNLLSAAEDDQKKLEPSVDWLTSGGGEQKNLQPAQLDLIKNLGSTSRESQENRVPAIIDRVKDLQSSPMVIDRGQINLELAPVDQVHLQSTTGEDHVIKDEGQKNLESDVVDQVNLCKTAAGDDQNIIDRGLKNVVMSLVDQVDLQSTTGEGHVIKDEGQKNLESDVVDQVNLCKTAAGDDHSIIDRGLKNVVMSLVDQVKVLQSTSGDHLKIQDEDQKNMEPVIVDQVKHLEPARVDQVNDLQLMVPKNLEPALIDPVNDLIERGQKNLEPDAVDQVRSAISEPKKEAVNFGKDVDSADQREIEEKIEPEKRSMSDDEAKKETTSRASEGDEEIESDPLRVSDESNGGKDIKNHETVSEIAEDRNDANPEIKNHDDDDGEALNDSEFRGPSASKVENDDDHGGDAGAAEPKKVDADSDDLGHDHGSRASDDSESKGQTVSTSLRLHGDDDD